MSEGTQERDPAGTKTRRTNGWVMVAVAYGSVLLNFLPAIRSLRVAAVIALGGFGLAAWVLLVQLQKQGFKRATARLLASGLVLAAVIVWSLGIEPEPKPEIAVSLNLSSTVGESVVSVTRFVTPFESDGYASNWPIIMIPVKVAQPGFEFGIFISNASVVPLEKLQVTLDVPKSFRAEALGSWQPNRSFSHTVGPATPTGGKLVTNFPDSFWVQIDAMLGRDARALSPLRLQNLPPAFGPSEVMFLLAESPDFGPVGCRIEMVFIRTNATDAPPDFAGTLALDRPFVIERSELIRRVRAGEFQK